MTILQDTTVPFLSETVGVNAAQSSDKANTRFAAMSIEVVQYYPKTSLGIELNHSLQVSQKVCFGSGLADNRIDDFPRCYMEISEQAERSVAYVLKF